MREPNNKRAIELGTVTTPHNRIARTNCFLTSSTFFSIANFDKCGNKAVTMEIVTIEYGNNIM
jgi:hypothetical protein